MAMKSYVLIKTMVLLWAAVCVVVAEHQKRDVHRIIIKERVPRSHNRGHGHNSHGRKKGHNHKKGKRGSDESHSNSSEGSFSNENSFEDFFHSHKTHRPSHKNPSFTHHFPTHLDIEESRQHSYKEEIQPFYNSEWVPVNSENFNSNLFSRESPYREKDRRNKRKSKKHNHGKNSHKPYGNLTNSPHNILVPSRGKPFGDLTSSQSFATSQDLGKPFQPSFESSTLYPPLDVLSTFSALNKKLLETRPTVISSFDQTTTQDNFDRLKNHKNEYDVHESNSSALGGYILVPDKSELGSFEYNSPEKFDTRLNSRPRGSIKFSNKF